MKSSSRFGVVSRRGSLLAAAAAAGAVMTLTGAAAPEPAHRPFHGGLHLIGDSWGAGLHADPRRALGQVAAEALAMRPAVDALSGTGYVNTAGQQNYLERARTATGSPRLVVVQGGSNDGGHALTLIRSAALDTYRVLQRRFPAAQVLALGPGPDPAPVDAAQRAVDATLRDAAGAAGITYVSMLDEHWVPSDHVDLVIDPTTDHPSVAGQAYLGYRLAAVARVLQPQLFTAA